MSCKNKDCGCEDQPIRTYDNLCNGIDCAESPACEEYFDTTCILQSFGIRDIALPENATMAEIVQRLILAISNPSCLVNGSCASSAFVFLKSKTATTIKIAWKEVPAAVTYEVLYKLEASVSWTSLGTQSTLSATITGLTSGETYHVKVNTACMSGDCDSITMTITLP